MLCSERCLNNKLSFLFYHCCGSGIPRPIFSIPDPASKKLCTLTQKLIPRVLKKKIQDVHPESWLWIVRLKPLTFPFCAWLWQIVPERASKKRLKPLKSAKIGSYSIHFGLTFAHLCGSGSSLYISMRIRIFIWCGSRLAKWFGCGSTTLMLDFWQIVPERACAWLDPRAGRRAGGGGPRLGPHLLLPQVRGPGGGRSGTVPPS